jgi:PAS domain S-box-containing protein
MSRLRSWNSANRLRRFVGGQSYLVKITLALAILVAIVATMGYLLITQSSALLGEQSQEELEQSSLVHAQQLDVWSTTIERDTSRIATADPVQNDDILDITRYLDTAIDDTPPSVVAIHYVDFSGDRARIETSTELGKRGTQLLPSQTPWANRDDFLTQNRNLVSAPYERDIGGQVVAFLEPVTPTRAVVLVVDSGIAALGVQAPEGGKTFAVNQRGTIVTSTNPNDIGESAFERGYLTQSAFEQAQDTPAGVFSTTYTASIRYDGEKQLTGMTRLSTQNWLTVTQKPASEAFVVRDRIQWLLLVLVAGVLLAGGGIVGTLGYTTVRDLKTLSAKAQAIEDGNYEVELATDRGDEIGDAYRSVEGMRETLAEQIRESALVEHSYDLLTVIDTDGTITYQSPSVTHIIGVDPADIEGRNLFEKIHHEETVTVRETVQNVAENPDTEHRFEFRIQDGAGEWRYFEGICVNQLDDPFVEGLILSSRDISERKERERKLESQNERLEKFASVISHDLRNPLNVAQLRIGMVDGENAETVERNLDRMEALIEDVLAMARGGQAIEETGEVSLSRVTDQAWTQVQTEDATLTCKDDVVIEADKSRCKQLFENLFRNSIDHVGTDVRIRVGPLDDGFYVEDDGPGIPEQDRENVFDAGYTTDEDGTGFGLNIVQEVAQAHGWTVDIADGTDGGARFEITGVNKPQVDYWSETSEG